MLIYVDLNRNKCSAYLVLHLVLYVIHSSNHYSNKVKLLQLFSHKIRQYGSGNLKKVLDIDSNFLIRQKNENNNK